MQWQDPSMHSPFPEQFPWHNTEPPPAISLSDRRTGFLVEVYAFCNTEVSVKESPARGESEIASNG